MNISTNPRHPRVHEFDRCRHGMVRQWCAVCRGQIKGPASLPTSVRGSAPYREDTRPDWIRKRFDV